MPQLQQKQRHMKMGFLLCGWLGVLVSTLSTTTTAVVQAAVHSNSLRIVSQRTSSASWGRRRRNGFITALTRQRQRPDEDRWISPAAATASAIWKLRAGASVDVADDNKEEEEDEDEKEEEDEDDDEKEEENDDDKVDSSSSSDHQQKDDLPHSVLSKEPIAISVYTSMGSRLLDVSWEGTTTRARNVGELKRIVAKGLPGRPPEAVMQFRFHGRLLQDDQELVDELMKEQEEEEGAVDDDDEDASSDPKLALQLDMIPPVDPKFGATYFHPQPPLTTLELLEAYAANAAAMYAHAQLILREEKEKGADDVEGDENEATTSTLPSPSSTTSTTSLTVQLQQRARLLRQDLQATFPEKVQTLLEQEANGTATTTTATTDPLTGAAATAAAHAVVQRRGQRVRVSGGAKTNLKRTVQRNLNLNWPDTFRNVCLFLFFGFFGGRGAWSKYLLLLGAPMSILVQARPVKYWIKRLFYSLVFPPAVILSLLPAPQQAILNYHAREAFAALYPTLAAQYAKLAAGAAAAAKAAHADQAEAKAAAAASQASKVAAEEEEEDDEDEDDEEDDDDE